MDTQQFKQALLSSGLFNQLSDSEATALIPRFETVTLPAGSTIVRQGEQGDIVYFIGRGEVNVYVDNGQAVLLNSIQAGGYFGEIALLVDIPRTTSVISQTDVTLYTLQRTGFLNLFVLYPDMLQQLYLKAKARLEKIQQVQLLQQYFQLDKDDLEQLQGKCAFLSLPAGKRLYNQGDDADAMYLIAHGRVRLCANAGSDIEKSLYELGAGQVVGQFSMLTDEPRSCTAYATRQTELVQINKAVFEQLMIAHPKMILTITQAVVRRHKEMLGQHQTKQTNIVLIPLQPDTPTSTFCQQLVEAMSLYGKVMHLNPEHVEQHLPYKKVALIPFEHPLNNIISTWLGEQENHYEHIIYEAENELSPWTKRCIQTADRIILLSEANASNQPGEIDRFITKVNSQAQVDLALLQDNVPFPRNTKKWLDARTISAHYHLIPGNKTHLGRMARRLTNNAIGLVLGGGGARGFAHVGVWRAIKETGLELDAIGGSSMGALIGAMFVTGHDDKAIIAMSEEYRFPKGLMDYTFPTTAILKGHILTEWLQKVHKGIDLEDLWIPFFTVSSNLSRLSQKVHCRGPLWKAVRASMAIPTLFPPLCDEGEILVDGGIMNNMPIDIMQNYCTYTIAVSVTPVSEPRTDFDFTPSLSGWRVLWSRLNPFETKIKVPSLSSILLRSLDVNSASKMRQLEQQADLLIRLPVKEFTLLDFERYREIIECGYEHSKSTLSEYQGRGNCRADVDIQT